MRAIEIGVLNPQIEGLAVTIGARSTVKVFVLEYKLPRSSFTSTLILWLPSDKLAAV